MPRQFAARFARLALQRPVQLNAIALPEHMIASRDAPPDPDLQVIGIELGEALSRP